MDLITWLIVGLVAGVLASLLVGAFVGGWIFRTLGVSTPFAGLAGIIFTAFIGAVVLLFLLHVIAGRRRTSL